MSSDGQLVGVLDRHGVEVGRRSWPVPEPLGAVVIVHGASEHSGRYARFAHALNRAGWAAYALDQRGHGPFGRDRAPGRVGPPGAVALVDDVEDLLEQAAAEVPGRPVVLFGHSLGSLVALATATTRPSKLAGLVLCGLPADPELGAQIAEGMAAMPDEARDLPGPSLAGFNQAFEPARTDYDWLTRDEAEVDAYLRDPLCGEALPLTLGYMADVFSLLAPAVAPAALSRLRMPVHLIAGGADPAAALGHHVHQLHAALSAAGVTVTSRVYPEARHELLNETNRDEVTSDIVAWCDKRRG